MIRLRCPRRLGHGAEQGSALLAALAVTLILGSMTAILVSTSMTHNRVTEQNVDLVLSFHMAERGLEEAQWELGEDSDLDGDGIGNKAISTPDGSFDVVATDLGGDLWELTSTGTVGNESTVVTEVVQVNGLGGATAPITLIGNLGNLPQWQFSLGTNLILDGGKNPAMVITEQDTFDETLVQLKQGLIDGFLNASNITGGGQSGLDAISHDPFELGVSPYETMHADLWNYWSSRLMGFSPRGSIVANKITNWGTPSSPVTYYFNPNERLLPNRHITGYGTLILQQGFFMESGSTLDWHGDVVILGKMSNDVELEINSGATLSVDGNLTIVGDMGRDVLIETGGSAQINVDGAMTLVADTTDPLTNLQVSNQGGINLNGLMTVVAPNTQMHFNPGSDVLINGSTQFGVFGSVFDFQVHDNVEIISDPSVVEDSVGVMMNSNPTLQLPAISGGGAITGPKVEVFGWRVVH